MAGTLTDDHFVTRDRMGRTMAFLARQIKAGSYEFDEPLTPLAVLDMLTKVQQLVKANGFVKGFSSITADSNADLALRVDQPFAVPRLLAGRGISREGDAGCGSDPGRALPPGAHRQRLRLRDEADERSA